MMMLIMNGLREIEKLLYSKEYHHLNKVAVYKMRESLPILQLTEGQYLEYTKKLNIEKKNSI